MFGRNPLRSLAHGRFLKRLGDDLHAIVAQLDRQNALLARLADQVAPEPVAPDRATVTADTGVSHFDVGDAALALAYVAKTEADTGHTPDDDEILVYLADEKTTDLHKRLAERDQELQRLAESRRW